MIRFRATYLLIAVNIVVFLIGWQQPLENWTDVMGYGFTHERPIHLLFNMFALLTFGLGVERVMGSVRMYWCYIAALVAGGVAQLLFQPGAPVIGASAGIYGLLFAYSLANRNKPVLLLVFPMKAQTLAIIAIAVELLCVAFGWLPGIAHFAHLGGVAAGGVAWVLWSRKHGQV